MGCRHFSFMSIGGNAEGLQGPDFLESPLKGLPWIPKGPWWPFKDKKKMSKTLTFGESYLEIGVFRMSITQKVTVGRQQNFGPSEPY